MVQFLTCRASGETTGDSDLDLEQRAIMLELESDVVWKLVFVEISKDLMSVETVIYVALYLSILVT